MRHVVLDTNALIQALPTRSRYHKIWTDFLAGRYCLCVSNEILTKYEEILAVHASPEVAHNVVEAIAIFDRLKQIPFPQLNVLTLDESNDTLKT